MWKIKLQNNTIITQTACLHLNLQWLWTWPPSSPQQKVDATEEVESVEPPRAEKKKTRKGKKGAASPEDEEGDGGEGQGEAELKDKNKVRTVSVFWVSERTEYNQLYEYLM